MSAPPRGNSEKKPRMKRNAVKSLWSSQFPSYRAQYDAALGELQAVQRKIDHDQLIKTAYHRQARAIELHKCIESACARLNSLNLLYEWMSKFRELEPAMHPTPPSEEGSLLDSMDLDSPIRINDMSELQLGRPPRHKLLAELASVRAELELMQRTHLHMQANMPEAAQVDRVNLMVRFLRFNEQTIRVLTDHGLEYADKHRAKDSLEELISLRNAEIRRAVKLYGISAFEDIPGFMAIWPKTLDTRPRL